MHFDLYSDLHDNWWSKEKLLNYKGLGTSLVAVVAGDISNDWDYTFNSLVKISECYRHVIFVDGNHEHNHKPNLIESCYKFQERLSSYRNITYLYKSAIVLDDTAFVGCNGWWTYDFCTPQVSTPDCWHSLINEGFDENRLSEIFMTAKIETKNLKNQVESFNHDPRINNIVVITHTSPLKKFGYINPDMGYHHMGRAGNSMMSKILEVNTNNKIRVWCFGHVHHRVDETIDGIRYVCHPRGREEEGIGEIYFPKLIEF
jgi:predicted phosphodiesterase